MRAFAVLALGLLTAACQTTANRPSRTACEASEWRLLYVNGPDGEGITGDKSQLLAAVRRGSPLRVAWGESTGARETPAWSVEEFSDVGFTNIIGGTELVVQLQPALIQTDYLEASKAQLRSPVIDWQAIMATDGRFDAVMTDRATGATVRELHQRTTAHWFAFAPAPDCDRRAPGDVAPPGRKNRLEP